MDTGGESKIGTVCTFYSFKGGVGRSMAVANVGSLLARWGQRVLIVDFDLEAPGIEQYFVKYSLQGSPLEQPGIVDLVLAFRDGRPLNWTASLCRAYPFRTAAGAEPVSILTAGKRDDGYLGRLQSIDWRNLFLERGFGDYLEDLRAQWLDQFDFVLLDSRTGYTDAGGICTIQLPDILVTVLTTNDQNLSGTLNVVRQVRAARHELPVDRGQLYVLPIPSRVESWTEYAAARDWHNKFQQQLGPFIDEWLPRREISNREILNRDVLDQLTLPHVAFWSFGEGLPVVEEGTEGKLSLGRAYAFLAGLIRSRLDYTAIATDEPSAKAERGTRTIVELAESAFQALSPEEQKLATAAFARMVAVSDDPEVPPTVRPLPLADYPQLRETIEKLAKANVVVLKSDSAYLSDETLLRSWSRLREAVPKQLRDDIDTLRWVSQTRRTGASATLFTLLFASRYRGPYTRLLNESPAVLTTKERDFLTRLKTVFVFWDIIAGLYGLLMLAVVLYLAWKGSAAAYNWIMRLVR